jgi:hypothetical protein
MDLSSRNLGRGPLLPRPSGDGSPGLAQVTAYGPGARPPSQPALTAQRARRNRSRPGPAPPPWEATSLAMESGSGGGRGEAIRTIFYSHRQLPPGHDPGADSSEAPRAGSVAHGH